MPGFRKKRIRITKLATAPITHISDAKTLTTEVAKGSSESDERSSHRTKAAAAAPKTTRSPRNVDLTAIEAVITMDAIRPRINIRSRSCGLLGRNDVMDCGRAHICKREVQTAALSDYEALRVVLVSSPRHCLHSKHDLVIIAPSQTMSVAV
jgi:hypothetical protein